MQLTKRQSSERKGRGNRGAVYLTPPSIIRKKKGLRQQVKKDGGILQKKEREWERTMTKERVDPFCFFLLLAPCCSFESHKLSFLPSIDEILLAWLPPVADAPSCPTSCGANLPPVGEMDVVVVVLMILVPS